MRRKRQKVTRLRVQRALKQIAECLPRGCEEMGAGGGRGERTEKRETLSSKVGFDEIAGEEAIGKISRYGRARARD